MKTNHLKTLSRMALAAMLALTVMQALVFAQDTQDTPAVQEESLGLSARASRLKGVWDARVTQHRCDTGDPIRTVRAMNMFIHGGTLYGTPGEISTPPLRGPSLGTWQHLGGRRYSAVMRFFLFNPDGSFAGTQKVTRTIELSRDSNEFAATASGEIFDADDILVQTRCATETATRLE